MPRSLSVLRVIAGCRPGAVFRVLAATLTLLGSVAPASSYQGRWTPPSSSWQGIAVHMALVRGDGSPYHSRVVWWQGEGAGSNFVGGQWGWKKNFGNADCTTYPDSAMIAISLPNPGDNLFCSSTTQLADGRAMVVGGTEIGTENGLKVANIFTPGGGTSAGSWAPSVDSMANGRYYPTATTLADGRVLASSGDKYPHIEFFGGRKDGATTPGIDSVMRFAAAFKGIWDPSIPRPSPSAVWPGPLTGLSAVVSNAYGKIHYFGGRDGSGQLTNKVWARSRDGSGSSPDYAYSWSDRTPPSGEEKPDPRMDQAILMRRDDTPYPEMLVVGGLAKHLDQAEAAVMDVWRHYKNPGLAGGYLWKQTIITNPSVGPSARSGHTAFLDKDHDQVLVFGGKPTSGSPSDYSVYALKFSNIGDPDLATWSKPVVQYAGVYPNPRYHHSMEVDVVSRKYQGSDLKSAVLFGGHGSGGTLYNDVWRLWIHASGDTVHWEEAAPVGDLPTVREGHTGTYESGSGRLIVFGGETSGGATDDIVKVLDLDNDPPTWRPFAARGYSLSGHTAVINSLIFARSPEIYTVGTNDWAQSPSSPHLQVWYPQMFQMPNGKVFAAGPAEDSYTFSPFSGVWEEFPPSSPPDHEIVGGGAVMYRPGLVMKAGSRDTEGENHAASGTTTWIDLTAGSPAWADGGSMSVGRVNHNLTVLPNGDVLATGGLGTIRDDQNIDPRRRPEIWSATNHAWSGGSGADTLAISRVPRGYHSTALLLPDGRIFCGGGNALEGAQNVGDVYCPPYLFNSGGTLATRPNLIAATGRWRYNADVTFAVSGDTAIRNACLIHAGATTHGQDGAQRYVPLTLLSSASRSDGVRQYFLKAPADSCIAPPGDYLLFVSNAAGVPAIAQWVRVGRAESGQFDVTAPDELTFGTTFIYCDAISAISWPAPGDDGGTGTALDYDIRYSWSPITSANFSNATPLPGVSIPQLAATTQSGIGFTGLTPSTQLYVAGKTRDKAGNWSALSFGQFSTLSSCGGGGYGASARRDRDEGSSGRVSNSPPGGGALSRGFAAPNALISSGSTLRLVGEFADEAAPRWQLDVRDLGDDRGLLEATMDHAVIQAPGADGTWWTRGSTPVSPGPMGVRSLPRGGRIIFPAGTALEAIELAPRGFACTGAAHSRLGDLRALDGTTTRPELASGDTLTLTFAPTTASSAGEDCFFRVRIPGAASPTTARARPGLTPRNPEAVDLPAVFALHAARPNPFSREAAIRFDLPRASAVKLEVFDVQGRRVATLANEVRDAGRHSLNWDGRTDSGPRAQAGIYLCRMTAGAFVSERRLSLLP